MPPRFKLSAFWFIYLLAASLTVVLACPIHEERENGTYMAHVCTNLSTSDNEEVPVIMLHGLTGTKEIWDGIYQNISLLSHRKVCVYDARNHGDSGWDSTFNIDVLAEDLGNFMCSMKIERATLVGHSMGGWTAMKFALKNPSKVEKLFIEDISPIGIQNETLTAINSYLKLLMSSVSVIPNDADEDAAQKALTDYFIQLSNHPPPAHLFVKFPFVRRDGVWDWKANFDVFIKALDDFDPFLGAMKGQYDGKTFFIYGKASSIKVDDDEEAIRKLFPNAQFFGVEGAGHVIHSQHPEYLRELMKFLK